MTKLSKYEKETIINWNEAEDTASIYTFNADLKRRLAEFSRKYPQLCRLERSTTEGSVTYVMDKSRLSIRLVPPYSEERLAAAREYAKQHGFHPVFCSELVPGYPGIPPCREMRQKEHSEPEELTETAQTVKVSFSGQEYRGRQALCAGYRGAAPCWGQGASPIGGLRAAAT